MARETSTQTSELTEEQLKRWQDKFEEKKADLDADDGEATVQDHNGSRVMQGDTTEGEEWLTFEYEDENTQVVEH